MERITIDINADVGEGVGNEHQLIPLLSSCNISCGAHAGSTTDIETAITLAKQHGVKIGAHPSYPDKENFGRKVLDISDEELWESISSQLYTFTKTLKKLGGDLHHIKAHGALYNVMVKDKHTAQLFLNALANYTSVPLFVPYNSVIATMAKKQGFTIIYEGFADRNYNTDLSLVSRTNGKALKTDPEHVVQHVVQMATENKVTAVDGQTVRIKAETFCIHGDSPSALEILVYLHQELPKYQLTIAK